MCYAASESWFPTTRRLPGDTTRRHHPATQLTARRDRRSFLLFVRGESFATPLHRSQAHGGAHLSALSEHESRAHQLVPASDHSARTVPLVRIDLRIIRPARRSTRERSPHASSPSGQSRSVGADRHRPELPTTEAPRAGSSSGEPVLPCRGRLARRGHHLAPRPALVRATGAETNRAGDL
jgi:hypothetical protein